MQLKKISIFIYVFLFVIINFLQNKTECSENDMISITTSNGTINYKLNAIDQMLRILLSAFGKRSLEFQKDYVVKEKSNADIKAVI